MENGEDLYKDKNEPEFKFVRSQNENRRIGMPVCIALNSIETILFICDFQGIRIHLFTVEGYFVTSFLSVHLKRPCGIAVYKNTLYVTDVKINSLVQFRNYSVKSTGKCGIRVGELQFPRSVTCDTYGDVFVADSNNLRIVVYSDELRVKRVIHSKVCWKPLDSRIFHEELIVLSEYKPYIHCYNLTTESVRYINQIDQHIGVPGYFTVDAFGNFVINDGGLKRIVITNQNGELLKTIGIGDDDTNLIFYGIQVASFNKIFCVCLSFYSTVLISVI